MKPGGNIILVENSEGSDPKDFIPMIMQSNLKLKDIIYPDYDDIIYIHTNYLLAIIIIFTIARL